MIGLDSRGMGGGGKVLETHRKNPKMRAASRRGGSSLLQVPIVPKHARPARIRGSELAPILELGASKAVENARAQQNLPRSGVSR